MAKISSSASEILAERNPLMIPGRAGAAGSIQLGTLARASTEFAETDDPRVGDCSRRLEFDDEFADVFAAEEHVDGFRGFFEALDNGLAVFQFAGHLPHA
jgi:hypothetical protein